MESFYNRLNIIFTFFFVLGILLSSYNLFNLSDNLEKISVRVDLSVIRELTPVLNQTYFIIGLTLLMGLGAIIFSLYLLNYAKSIEKVIYVEKSEGRRLEEKDKSKQTPLINISDQVEEICTDIDEIRDPRKKYEKLLSNLCMKINASQGIIYQAQKIRDQRYIELFTSFAYSLPEREILKYEFGEGLVGQVAKENKKLNIQDVPEGYISIVSGHGASSPTHLAILPIEDDCELLFVVEIASFNEITKEHENLIVEALKMAGKKPIKSI